MSNHPATISEVFFVMGEKTLLYVVPTKDCGCASIPGEKEKYLRNNLLINPVIAERDEKARVTFFWMKPLNYRIANPEFYFRECSIDLPGARTEKYRLQFRL